MSEDEYDDELPPICVHSTSRDSAEWVMPSAGAVASEREREQATERELQLLRLHHEHDDAAAPKGGTIRVAQPPHSDSSSSEGEALTAAVTALHVHAAPVLPYKDGAAVAAEFLSALRANLPYPDDRLLSHYLDVLHSDHCTIKAVTNDMVRRICSVIVDEATEWTESHTVTCAGALSAAAMARVTGTSGRATRALHALLDWRAKEEHISALRSVLRRATPQTPLRLRLASIARSGGRGGADALAHGLVADALVRVLRAPTDTVHSLPQEPETSPLRALDAMEGGASAWRAMGSAQKYAALQLAGRALCACAPAQRARPLRALAALVQPSAKEKHQPDHLKVVVGAATLQLLFRADHPA